MQTPFFSIIIPTFNSAATIQNAVDSILQQLFQDLEVVVVDGSSKDNTVAILEENSKKDNRVRVISEIDKGIFDAMNKGIAIAKGSWLYFMGSDDHFFDNSVLQRVYETLKENPCDLLYGYIYSAKSKGSYGGHFNKEKVLLGNISHQAIFYRKDIHERIGYYNIDYTSFADWDFNIRCFLDDSIRKLFVNITVAYFEQGGASTTNPDIYFLRNSLLPKNLFYLKQEGASKLYNIQFYDKWWRLVRSLRLQGENGSLTQFAGGEPVPAAVKQMALFQRHFSYNTLKQGVLSKLLMAISYIINLVLFRFGK